MSKDATIKFGDGHTLVYKDSNHAYHLDGKRVVSVSTLARVSYNDPGSLMAWAVRETKEGRDHNASRDLAAACGTAAHDQLEALAKTGQPLDLKGQPERVRGALQAVAKWWFQVKPKFVASEVLVASAIHGYAGRFDFLCTVDGELCLGDLKSDDGKPWEAFRRYKAEPAFAQLAGYSISYAECYPASPQPTGRYILKVGANGEFSWVRDAAPEKSEESFLSKLRTYRSSQEWSKAFDAQMKAAA